MENKFSFIDKFIFIDYDIDLPDCWVRKGWYEVIDVNKKEWLIDNEYFGRHLVPDEEMSFPASADSEEECDYSLLLDSESDNGWISPSGEFYGCGFFYHRTIAEKYLKSSEEELENKGWIKLTSVSGPIANSRNITAAQKSVLLRKDYSEEKIERDFNIIY